MMPAVPLPRNSRIRIPVDVKLKRHWSYVPERRVFVSESGETCARRDLPRKTRIVYKVPALARANEAKLSKPEKDLRRYLQVILPAGESAADYVRIIRAWPSVEEAHVAPDVSLPTSSSTHRS